MFRGIAQLNLDSKGRLAVPARHRDVLLERCRGHLEITADADRCLLMYPLPEWEVIQQKLEGLSNLDPRVRELQRRLMAGQPRVYVSALGKTGELIVDPLNVQSEAELLTVARRVREVLVESANG